MTTTTLDPLDDVVAKAKAADDTSASWLPGVAAMVRQRLESYRQDIAAGLIDPEGLVADIVGDHTETCDDCGVRAVAGEMLASGYGGVFCDLCHEDRDLG